MGKLALAILGIVVTAVAAVNVIQSARPGAPHPPQTAGKSEEAKQVPSTATCPGKVTPPTPARPALSPEKQYEAAWLKALGLAGAHQFGPALASLEDARTIHNTCATRRAINRLRARLERQQAAERTIHDIQAVLKNGSADETARLAAAALEQYGDGEAAGQLVVLKRAAEALIAVAPNDPAARQGRYRAERDEALRGQNLRTAAIVLEQLAECSPDPNVGQQLAGVQATLAYYDNHRRATELRSPPDNRETALTALREAARVWDTLEIRQDIADCTLALRHRRHGCAGTHSEAAFPPEDQRAMALLAAARPSQQRLARQTQTARARAEQEAKARSETANRAREQLRRRAHEFLLAKGQKALQQQNLCLAIQHFESAQALKPTEAGRTALDLAKAQAALADQQRAAAEALVRQAEQRRRQDAACQSDRMDIERWRNPKQSEAPIKLQPPQPGPR